MVEEARLEQTGAGLAPVTDGWFALNVRDALWLSNEYFRNCCVFEGTKPAIEGHTFADVGFTLAVLEPGQPSGMYHRESNQEDFLVLSGECLAIIEGEERQLKAWDFVHCPPETEHIFVGAGEGPCVIFMTGGRTREKEIVYPRNDLALRHGAGVETETSVPNDAYAPFPHWQAKRPESWDGLPWS